MGRGGKGDTETVSQLQASWPPLTYQEEQRQAEITRENREARRRAAIDRRDTRRWWATRIPLALLALAAVVVFMWALVPVR